MVNFAHQLFSTKMGREGRFDIADGGGGRGGSGKVDLFKNVAIVALVIVVVALAVKVAMTPG